MPLRRLNREQRWLFPPTLDELLSDTLPARFVAEFVDGLDRAQRVEMGVGLDGDPLASNNWASKTWMLACGPGRE